MRKGQLILWAWILALVAHDVSASLPRHVVSSADLRAAAGLLATPSPRAPLPNSCFFNTFDALGRLVQVTMRGSSGTGWNWTAGYNPLGRRVETAYSVVSNNVATLQTSAVTLWDPLYPMQEVYRQVSGGSNYFYLYGPDLSDSENPGTDI